MGLKIPGALPQHNTVHFQTDFLLATPEPKLHAKFEVASFNGCRNWLFMWSKITGALT